MAGEEQRIRCIVKGCENHKDEGRFIGDLCAPCHNWITTNSPSARLSAAAMPLNTYHRLIMKNLNELEILLKEKPNETH